MLVECAGCREPLFADAAKCTKCGLANPAYEEPRWVKVVPVLAVVVLALLAGVLFGILGFTLVSVPAGAIVLRSNGAAAIILWVVGNIVAFVLCVVLVWLLRGVLPVPAVLIYAVLAMPLLVRLSQMKP